MDVKKISFVVLFNESSFFFKDRLTATVESLCAQLRVSDPGSENTQIVLAGKNMKPASKSIISSLCGDFSDLSFETCLTEDLNQCVQGEYVCFLSQGDIPGEDAVGKLISYSKDGEHDVILLNRKKEEIVNPQSDFHQVYDRPFILINSFTNLLFRKELVKDIRKLVGVDLRSACRVVRLVLAEQGFFIDREVYIARSDEWILKDFTLLFKEINLLFEYSVKKYHEILPYVQYAVLYYLLNNIHSGVNKETFKNILSNISDAVLLESRICNFHTKLYLLNLKYDRNILNGLEINDEGRVFLDDQLLVNVTGNSRLEICITTITDGMMTLEGRTDLNLFGDRYRLFISDKNDKLYPLVLSPYHPRDVEGFSEELLYEGYQFRVSFPIEPSNEYEIILEDEDERDFIIKPRFGDYSRLNNSGKAYFIDHGLIIRFRDNRFSVEKYKKGKHFGAELSYLFWLFRNKRRYTVKCRIAYHLMKPFVKKPVWILADRPHVAGDNAEHLFRYLMQKTQEWKDHRIYFLISRESPDYERIRKIGRVLEYNSVKHQLFSLYSDMIIAAAANNLALNAFGQSAGRYYRDLYHFKFVYLRHGVSHNDQSRWINRLSKNIRVLVATCRPEYEGILNGDYGYTQREIHLTGLARFDNLYDERKKIIAILPTWRHNLEGEIIPGTSKRAYIPDFRDSEYFRFFDSLIHDERLNSAMEEYGYRGVFYLHPVFEAQFPDFTSSEFIEVGNGVADYQKVFRESSLLITDYSSVGFDFAYLKKPLIYAQFDEETFYLNHSWGKGYFTYRKDGFGPVLTSLDDTVDKIIDYLAHDCQMEEEYLERVDNFFAFTDRNNCQRILAEIKKAERDQ